MNRVSHFYRLEHISNIPILHAAKDISRGIIMSDAIAQASPIPAVGLIGMECSEKIEDGQKYYDIKIVATLDSYPSIPQLLCPHSNRRQPCRDRRWQPSNAKALGY